MVRLTDTAALQILLLLGVIKARTPKEYTLQSAGQDFEEAVQVNTTEAIEGYNPTTKTLVADAVYQSRKDSWVDKTVTEIVNNLATGLQESFDKVNKDRNLIDELACILRLPLPENRLHSGNIETLQKLILTPSELKEANKSLDASCGCPSCGHKFLTGEVATPSTWDRGDKDSIVFYCVNCKTPSYVRCAETGCDNYIEAGKARLGRESYCPAHASPKSIHEPSKETVQARAEKAEKESQDYIALRETRTRATRVRFVVDPNAPPQRGGGLPDRGFRPTLPPRRDYRGRATIATADGPANPVPTGNGIGAGAPTTNVPTPFARATTAIHVTQQQQQQAATLRNLITFDELGQNPMAVPYYDDEEDDVRLYDDGGN